jgi:hypothetical protein
MPEYALQRGQDRYFYILSICHSLFIPLFGVILSELPAMSLNKELSLYSIKNDVMYMWAEVDVEIHLGTSWR